MTLIGSDTVQVNQNGAYQINFGVIVTTSGSNSIMGLSINNAVNPGLGSTSLLLPKSSTSNSLVYFLNSGNTIRLIIANAFVTLPTASPTKIILVLPI